MPAHERTIQWDDSDLNIDWPIGIVGAPIVSEKDSLGVSFKSAEVYD